MRARTWSFPSLVAVAAAYVVLPATTVEIPKSAIDTALATNLPYKVRGKHLLAW